MIYLGMCIRLFLDLFCISSYKHIKALSCKVMNNSKLDVTSIVSITHAIFDPKSQTTWGQVILVSKIGLWSDRGP